MTKGKYFPFFQGVCYMWEFQYNFLKDRLDSDLTMHYVFGNVDRVFVRKKVSAVYRLFNSNSDKEKKNKLKK